MNQLLNEGYLISSMTSNGPLILVVFEREVDSELISFAELKRRLAENTSRGRIMSGDEVYRMVSSTIDEIKVGSVLT